MRARLAPSIGAGHRPGAFVSFLVPALVFVHVFAPAPVRTAELCLGPTPEWGNVTVDCSVGQVSHVNAWIGYATDGTPCGSHGGTFPCQVVPGDGFGWSISASETDPAVNGGPLGGAVGYLYLWLDCAYNEGMAAAAFVLEGDLPLLSFTPRNGFLNAGTGNELLLAVGGCPTGPVVAATS